MANFSKRQLICSFICPAICFLWGAVYFFVDLFQGELFKNNRPLDLLYSSAMLFGGIIPALITVIGKVETGSYLKRRGLIIIVVFVAFKAMTIGSLKHIHFYLFIIIGLAAFFYQILRVQDEMTTGGERAVLILSDPIIYWTVYWALSLWKVAFDY